MNKRIIFLLLLILPITIKADCSNQDLSRYKSLATQINYYTDFNESNKKFNITIYNLSNELILNNRVTDDSYYSQEKIGETRINDVTDGTTFKIYVFPKNGECSDYIVKSLYIKLPNYNQYYEEEICKNNDNVLCSKWTNTSVYTKEQFIEKVKSETKEEEPIVEEEPEEKYGIFDFLADYYIPIIIAAVIIIIGTKYLIERRKKFDF